MVCTKGPGAHHPKRAGSRDPAQLHCISPGGLETTLTLIERQAIELEAQRAAVQDALRIAHNRFRAGYASYLEELDAQRSLFSVEQLSVQLRADLLSAHVNLYRALAGGWSR